VGEPFQGRGESAFGEDRRVDPTRDLLQVLDRIGQPRRDAGQLVSKVIPVGRKVGLGGADGQSE
jgi:hypothetical protein